MSRKCGEARWELENNHKYYGPLPKCPTTQYLIIYSVRPISADIKQIDVSMVISCKEGVSYGVKGQMEETHCLALLNSADHRRQQTEGEKQYTLK